MFSLHSDIHFARYGIACVLCASIPAFAPEKPVSSEQHVTLASDRPLRIAAVVNDDVITTQDVEERALLVMALSGGGKSEEERARIIASTLSRLIDETLQSQESKRQSVNASDEEIDHAIAGLEKARGRPVGSLTQFIQQAGLSMPALRSQFAVQIAMEQSNCTKNPPQPHSHRCRSSTCAASRTQPPPNYSSISKCNFNTDCIARRVKRQPLRARMLSGKRLAAGESFDTLARSLIGAKDVVLSYRLMGRWNDTRTGACKGYVITCKR